MKDNPFCHICRTEQECPHPKITMEQLKAAALAKCRMMEADSAPLTPSLPGVMASMRHMPELVLKMCNNGAMEVPEYLRTNEIKEYTPK